MKIELVLSSTYLCQGKVYQKVDATGKRLAYTVADGIGNHLLAQRSERDIPYFRMVNEETPAHVPATKRHEKGGVPQPESTPAKPAADAAPAKPAAEPAADDAADEKLNLDDMSEDEEGDAVTL
jgi:hypothetical protein